MGKAKRAHQTLREVEDGGHGASAPLPTLRLLLVPIGEALGPLPCLRLLLFSLMHYAKKIAKINLDTHQNYCEPPDDSIALPSPVRHRVNTHNIDSSFGVDRQGAGYFKPKPSPYDHSLLHLGFFGYFALQVVVSVFTRGLTTILALGIQLRQLALPLLFSIVMGAILLPSVVGLSPDGPSFAFRTSVPFLGKSAESDEISVLLVSLFLTFTSALARTSVGRERIAIDAASPHPYQTLKFPNSGREIVILQFVERASHLQRRSTYILAGIILMLACAAIFIVFAGQITSLDVSGVKSVSLAQSDVRAAEDELDRINTDIARKQAARRRATKEAKEQAAKEPASKDPSKLEASDDTFSPEGISDDEISKLKFEAKKDALKKANEVLLRVKDKQFEDDRPKDQTSGQLLLIQTSVTRFGVVLILVFLVQILVSLYRYNMKLSAFYFGRADALVLLGKLPSTLRALVDVISPDKLDFGKPPKTPAEEAGGLLHAWTGHAAGKRTSQNQDDLKRSRRK